MKTERGKEKWSEREGKGRCLGREKGKREREVEGERREVEGKEKEKEKGNMEEERREEGRREVRPKLS